MRKDAAVKAHVPRARRPRLQALAPRERRSLLPPDAPLAGALERERGPADR